MPQPSAATGVADVRQAGAACATGAHDAPPPSGGASYDPLTTGTFRTMVLAASLLPTDGPKDKPLDWKELLAPKSKLEVAALLIILVVRFLVVPFAGLGLVSLFQGMSWLPNDPICYLVVLVQAVMPSAQNIVLLMNLQSSTRPLAPTMARILLQLYLLSVVPLAMWMGAIIPMIGLSAV